MKDFSRRVLFSMLSAPIAVSAAQALRPTKFCRVCRTNRTNFSLIGYVWAVCDDCESSIVQSDAAQIRAKAVFDRDVEINVKNKGSVRLPNPASLEWLREADCAVPRYFGAVHDACGFPVGADRLRLRREWVAFAFGSEYSHSPAALEVEARWARRNAEREALHHSMPGPSIQ